MIAAPAAGKLVFFCAIAHLACPTAFATLRALLVAVLDRAYHLQLAELDMAPELVAFTPSGPTMFL